MQTTQLNMLNTFAVSQFNEVYLPIINRHTFESIDSKTLYDHECKHLLKSNTLHIIIGVDSGLLANYLLNKNLPINSQYIFVELTEVLNVLTIDIPNQLSSQFTIINYQEFKALISEINNEIYILKKKYQITYSMAARNDYIEDYIQLAHHIKEFVNQRYIELSTRFTQKSFIHKQLENIAETQFPAKILTNQFRNKTCIVIGGGPSLDDEINWLQQNQSHLFIIAASRVAGKLIKHGINPHILVTVDPQALSFDVNREIYLASEKSLLIFAQHACPAIVSQWQGKALYLGERFPWLIENHELANIDVKGPTVINSATHLATHMGFSQILLIGVDFCYSSTGISHEKNSLEAHIGPNLTTNGLWVETNSGKKAETPIQLKFAQESLQQEVQAHPHVKFINLSINAAKLQGVSYQKTATILLTDKVITPDEFLKNIPHSKSIKGNTDDLFDCMNEVNQVIYQLKSMLKLTKSVLKFSNRAENDIFNANKFHLYANKAEEVENIINQKYSKLSQLIKFYGYYEFSNFLTHENKAQWQPENMVKRTKIYYEAFNSSIFALLNYLNIAKQKIIIRQKEISGNTSLKTLLPHWKKHQEIGRIYRWENFHKINATLPLTENDLIEQTKQAFHQRLISQSNKYKTVLSQQQDFDMCRHKILTLAQNKNNDALVQMAQYLLPLINSEPKAKNLYHLALSFQCQYCHKFTEGLNHLLSINEAQRGEIELRQIIIFALKLQKLSLAKATLKSITQYSDEYIPQYAHVMRLQGKYQQAINLYLDYLAQYPNNLPIWLKLGVFMVDVNQLNSALTAFQQALNLDPQNILAKQYIENIVQLDFPVRE